MRAVSRAGVIAKRTPIPLGTIINEDFTTMANLGNYTVTNPNSTWALSGGFLRSTKILPGSAFGDYITYTPYGSTVLDRWVQVATVYVRATNTTGFVTGCKNTHPLTSTEYEFFINNLTGLTGVMVIYKDGNSVSQDLTVRTIALNDKLIITTERNYTQLNYTVQNVTQGWTNTISYTGITMSTTAALNQTMGKWWLCNRHGTWDIEGWNVSSAALKNVDYCFIGHSIPEGYNSGGISFTWPAKAMLNKNRSYTKLCSQSNYLGGMMQILNEIQLINADCYIMPDLRNDQSLGIAAGTYQADYATMYTLIKTTMKKRILLPLAIPCTGLDVRIGNNHIISTYPNDTKPDLFNTALLNPPFAMVANYGGDVNDDGTHPGPNGAAVTGAAMAPYIN